MSSASQPPTPQRVPIHWRGRQTYSGTRPQMDDTKNTVINQARNLILKNLGERQGTSEIKYDMRNINFADREHGLSYYWTGPIHDSVLFSDEQSDTDGRRNEWTGAVTVDMSF